MDVVFGKLFYHELLFISKLFGYGFDVDAFHIGGRLAAYGLKLRVFEKDYQQQMEPGNAPQKRKLTLQRVHAFEISKEYYEAALFNNGTDGGMQQLHIHFKVAGLLLI